MPRLDDTLKQRARAMRSEPTPAEARLWTALRAHRFGGVKIARQVIVGPYILDFAARTAKLGIELDGDTHGAQVAYDARRTAYLEQQGYRVLRFTNTDVTTNLEGVLLTIADALASHPPPLPNPSPQRGEGL